MSFVEKYICHGNTNEELSGEKNVTMTIWHHEDQTKLTQTILPDPHSLMKHTNIILAALLRT